MRAKNMRAKSRGQPCPALRSLRSWSRAQRTPKQARLAEAAYYYIRFVQMRDRPLTLQIRYSGWTVFPGYFNVSDDDDALKHFLGHLVCDDYWLVVDGKGRDFPFDSDTSSVKLIKLRHGFKRQMEFFRLLNVHLYQLDWEEVCDRRRMFAVRAKILHRPAKYLRSTVVWIIACLADEAGCNYSEIATVVAASKAWKHKQASKNRQAWDEDDLWKLIKNVRARAR